MASAPCPTLISPIEARYHGGAPKPSCYSSAGHYAQAQVMDAPARSFYYPPSPFNMDARAGGPDEGCIRRWKLSPELSPDDQV